MTSASSVDDSHRDPLGLLAIVACLAGLAWIYHSESERMEQREREAYERWQESERCAAMDYACYAPDALGSGMGKPATVCWQKPACADDDAWVPAF